MDGKEDFTEAEIHAFKAMDGRTRSASQADERLATSANLELDHIAWEYFDHTGWATRRRNVIIADILMAHAHARYDLWCAKRQKERRDG